MGKIAFVFAGQGAQHIGMGRTLYDSVPAVRTLFDAAEAERPGTLSMMFEGEEASLRQTANTQPCLYLADLAAAITLREMGIAPDAVAGFSLGEIPALAFSGAYSETDGFRISALRGIYMGDAAAAHPAAMAAILKLENETVEALCASCEGVWPVNYNCPGQLVVSARADAMPSFLAAVKDAGGRALPLSVSGGFHSPLMQSAAEKFGVALADFTIRAPQIPTYANRTAAPYGDDVRTCLTEQIVSPVLWENTVRALDAAGVDTFIECGPGNTLTKLIGKILPHARAFAVETAEQAAAVKEEIS